MRHLIFFTSQFPLGHGETFIENELPFLAHAFDRIFIVTNDINSATSRSIPEKVKVIRVSNQATFQYKMKALVHFFSPLIQNEISFIKNRLKLSLTPGILSGLLGTYTQALHTAGLIEDIMADNALTPQSVVLYSYWMSNTAAGIALYKRKNPAVKTVCRAHGWDVYFERHQPPYLPLRNFIINGLDYCCCISLNGKEYLENLLAGHTKNNVLVSRLGTLNRTGKRSGFNQNKLVIVSCSNIIPLKRIHLIIEALALIDDTDIDWTHFGSGELEQEIKNLAQQKLGNSTHIKHRFAGQISNSELLNYYAANNIDLFINVSETEGLPVSFMEAGSFGIPVIGTKVGGVSEIIQDGINGFLLDSNASPRQIAQTIKTYYSLPVKEKEIMRANAFGEWEKKYNAEINYKGFIEIVNKA